MTAVAPSFHVEVIEPGRKVKVGPDFTGNDVADTLEYASVLIEEGGWRQGSRGNDVPFVDLSTTRGGPGYSLHDAIGAACETLSGVEPGRTRSKDWSLTDPRTGEWHNIREEATAAVIATIKKRSGKLRRPLTDLTYNDEKAKSPADVIAVLAQARREVLKNGK